MSATKESLLELLNRKDLFDVAKELECNKTTFEEFKTRTREDWKDFYGVAGVDIFNHLHPPVITPGKIFVILFTFSCYK